MKVANKIADFSLAQADILRKAMGGKDPEEMEKLKKKLAQIKKDKASASSASSSMTTARRRRYYYRRRASTSRRRASMRARRPPKRPNALEGLFQ